MPKALFNKILVAIDGSESSNRAATVAIGLAEKLHTELIIFHAVSPPTSYYRSSYAAPVGMAPPPPPQKEIDAYYAYARRVAMGIVGDSLAEAKKSIIRNARKKVTNFWKLAGSVDSGWKNFWMKYHPTPTMNITSMNGDTSGSRI